MGQRAENNEADAKEIESETVSLDQVALIPVNLFSVWRRFDSNTGIDSLTINEKKC